MILSYTNSAIHLIKLSSVKSTLSTINSNWLYCRQPKPVSERHTKASIIRAKPTWRGEIRWIQPAMSEQHPAGDDRCSPHVQRNATATVRPRNSRAICTTDRMNAAAAAARLVNQCERCWQQTGRIWPSRHIARAVSSVIRASTSDYASTCVESSVGR